jgi:hypothetical protein
MPVSMGPRGAVGRRWAGRLRLSGRDEPTCDPSRGLVLALPRARADPPTPKSRSPGREGISGNPQRQRVAPPRGGTPGLARHPPLPAPREQESDPLAKTRKALEGKAAKGDVYATRELREHADWYYGSTQGDAWKALLTREELATVMSIFDAAHKRASSLSTSSAEDA